MIDGSENRNRQLAFELQNSHVCEKRSNINQLLDEGRSDRSYILYNMVITVCCQVSGRYQYSATYSSSLFSFR